MRKLPLILTSVLVIGMTACLLAQNADPTTGVVKGAPGNNGKVGAPARADGSTDPAVPPGVTPDPNGNVGGGGVAGGGAGGFVPGGPGGIPRVMPGGPGMGGPIVNFPGEQAEQTAAQLELMRQMTSTLFNARMAAVMAIFAIKDDAKLKGDEKVKLLTAQLEKTKTLGLRNAIRTALKDLYTELGQSDKATDQLKAMLEENDAALAKEKAAEEKP